MICCMKCIAFVRRRAPLCDRVDFYFTRGATANGHENRTISGCFGTDGPRRAAAGRYVAARGGKSDGRFPADGRNDSAREMARTDRTELHLVRGAELQGARRGGRLPGAGAPCYFRERNQRRAESGRTDYFAGVELQRGSGLRMRARRGDRESMQECAAK